MDSHHRGGDDGVLDGLLVQRGQLDAARVEVVHLSRVTSGARRLLGVAVGGVLLRLRGRRRPPPRARVRVLLRGRVLPHRRARAVAEVGGRRDLVEALGADGLVVRMAQLVVVGLRVAVGVEQVKQPLSLRTSSLNP